MKKTSEAMIASEVENSLFVRPLNQRFQTGFNWCVYPLASTN